MRIAFLFISYLLSTFLFERATIFLDDTRETLRKIYHNIPHSTLCAREGETLYILRLCPSCAFSRVLRYRRCIRRNKFRPSKARYMQSMTFEKRRSFVAFERLFFEREFLFGIIRIRKYCIVIVSSITQKHKSVRLRLRGSATRCCSPRDLLLR